MIDWLVRNPFCHLWAGLGSGKTVCTLTALDDLLMAGAVSRVLVISTPNVIRSVWKQEAARWDHLRHLHVEVCDGAPKQRKEILQRGAEITTISVQNFLTLNDEDWDWDCVVLDESTLFKNWASRRFKRLRQIRAKKRICRLICLTATPQPNSSLDLWAQTYLLDKGERLGKGITEFKNQWFFAVDRHMRVWRPRRGAVEWIRKQIQDITLVVRPRKATEARIIPHYLTLPPAARAAYDRLDTDNILDTGVGLQVINEDAGLQKLLQFCAGDVFGSSFEDRMRGIVHRVQGVKFDALAELIEQIQENVLVVYQYRASRERLLTLPGAEPLTPENIDRWNRGEIPVLVAHCASAGHGLNLQHGGHHMIFFGLPLSLEHREQMVGRLNRTGQTEQVYVHDLLFEDTVDIAVSNLLSNKSVAQLEIISRIENQIG